MIDQKALDCAIRALFPACLKYWKHLIEDGWKEQAEIEMRHDAARDMSLILANYAIFRDFRAQALKIAENHGILGASKGREL
jgi:hypothetical protein